MTTPLSGDDRMKTGAVWCEEHARWECSKQSKRSQTRCHAMAIVGIDACRNHGGQATGVLKAKGEAMSAWSALGGPVTVTHTQAVLGMLQMAWLRVHFYAGLLRQQVEAAQEQASVGELDGDGVGVGVGLIGHTHGAVKDIGIYVTGEAVRGLTKLEADERDRVVRFAKTAHDMKIDDQQIRLAEGQGLLLAQAVAQILDGLELTAAQQARVPQIVPAVLMEIGGGQ